MLFICQTFLQPVVEIKVGLGCNEVNISVFSFMVLLIYFLLNDLNSLVGLNWLSCIQFWTNGSLDSLKAYVICAFFWFLVHWFYSCLCSSAPSHPTHRAHNPRYLKSEAPACFYSSPFYSKASDFVFSSLLSSSSLCKSWGDISSLICGRSL